MLTLHYLNALFTGLFTLETFLKVHAFGPRVSLSARSRKPSSSPPTSLHLEPRTHLSDSLHLDCILCISCMSTAEHGCMNTASRWMRSRRMFFKSLQCKCYSLLRGTMSYNDFTSPIILIELIMIFLLYFITQYVYAPLIFICITCSVFDMTKVFSTE